MKDQYFGDVNDLRKYGPLRALVAATGLDLGVCWLRTSADQRTDGECRSYLREPERFRRHDPELYDGLRGLLHPDAERSVINAERWNLLPRATYHHAVLSDAPTARATYFADAWVRFSQCPLLFFDPDNGLEVKSVPYGRKDSAKYSFWRELESAVRRGHSFLLYQHFRREPRQQFVQRVADKMLVRLGVASVDSFGTAHVVFFLATRFEHAGGLDRVHSGVREGWAGQIQPVRHGIG